MLPQHHFIGSNFTTPRDHWASFEKYATFQRRLDSINTFSKFKNTFALTLIDIVLNCFEPIINNILDMANLKVNFMKIFNLWE